MPQNYGEMYNNLSNLHKINHNPITELKNKLAQKEDEIKARKKLIANYMEENDLLKKENNLLKEEVKKSKEKVDSKVKEIDILNEELKKLKKTK